MQPRYEKAIAPKYETRKAKEKEKPKSGKGGRHGKRSS